MPVLDPAALEAFRTCSIDHDLGGILLDDRHKLEPIDNGVSVIHLFAADPLGAGATPSLRAEPSPAVDPDPPARLLGDDAALAALAGDPARFADHLRRTIAAAEPRLRPAYGEIPGVATRYAHNAIVGARIRRLHDEAVAAADALYAADPAARSAAAYAIHTAIFDLFSRELRFDDFEITGYGSFGHDAGFIHVWELRLAEPRPPASPPHRPPPRRRARLPARRLRRRRRLRPARPPAHRRELRLAPLWSYIKRTRPPPRPRRRHRPRHGPRLRPPLRLRPDHPQRPLKRATATPSASARAPSSIVARDAPPRRRRPPSAPRGRVLAIDASVTIRSRRPPSQPAGAPCYPHRRCAPPRSAAADSSPLAPPSPPAHAHPPSSPPIESAPASPSPSSPATSAPPTPSSGAARIAPPR